METEFTTIGKVEDVEEGRGCAFDFRGARVAVFQVNGEFFAIDDFCPHAGASLSEGNVEDHAVYCPWHAWRFCIKDGTWLDNPRAQLRQASYDVQVEGEFIRLRERN